MSDAETIARKLWKAEKRAAAYRGRRNWPSWEKLLPLSRDVYVAAVQSLLDDGTIRPGTQ